MSTLSDRDLERPFPRPRAPARPGRERDVVSTLGLIAVLMLIAGAITAILSHSQRVGIVTWLVLLFVSGCFAGSYWLLRAIVMPRVEARAPAHWLRHAAHAAVIVVAVAAGCELAARSLELLGGDPAAKSRRQLLPVGTAITVAMVIVEEGYRRLRRRAREHELGEERLRRQTVKAELAALQARTDPHFLFNSLNTVAGLIEEDPPKASEVLQRLAGLYRYALEGSRAERVPLGDEISAVRDFLAVEALRFGDRLRWSVIADDELLLLPVPPLLLLPVVENAVTHGIAPRPGPGTVTVRATGLPGRLRLEVEDDGTGEGASPRRGSGSALADLGDRLQLAYGDAARLDRSRGDGSGFVVRITLPLAPAEEAGP